MLDEMPMLYCSTLLIFTCIETKYGKQGRWLPICTAIWLAVTTTFFSMTTGTLQSLTFQTNNILMQVGVVYLLRGFYVQRQSIRPNAFIVPLTKVSLGAAVIAALTWLIDYNLCVYINGVSPETLTSFNPQFHAVWHFFSGMAMFGVSILVIYYHHDMRKDNSSPSIYLWRRVLPAVSLQASSSKKKQ
ncbi:hypothetical protein BGZ83_009461 [Gryganskiella cystojenkinii]|nr:hypothetical protein BGZ83_009461 [Gryganskiella cystojenkinii]